MIKTKSLGRLIIIISIITILIVALSSISYAFWGSDPSRVISGNNSSVIDVSSNITYRYMIFETTINNTDCHFKYSDTDKVFIVYQLYEDDLEEVSINNVSSVSIIGYKGTMGEYEDLLIPSSITIKIGDNTKEVNVTKIDMHSVEEDGFTAMHLIKNVIIPSSITSITGSSFSGWGNLEMIYFDTTTLPSIGTYCFINSQSVQFFKKNGSDNYIETTITRGGN